jgi:hypothetical protein
VWAEERLVGEGHWSELVQKRTKWEGLRQPPTTLQWWMERERLLDREAKQVGDLEEEDGASEDKCG